MLPDHSGVRSSGERHDVIRVASTSAGKVGISAGPGAMDVNDAAGALIVVFVSRGRMLYDQLPPEIPRSFCVMETWRRPVALYHAVRTCPN